MLFRFEDNMYFRDLFFFLRLVHKLYKYRFLKLEKLPSLYSQGVITLSKRWGACRCRHDGPNYVTRSYEVDVGIKAGPH